MHSVSFLMRNSPVQMSFVFKAYKAANDLFKKAQAQGGSGVIHIEDDFDSLAFVDMSCVACVSFVEVEKEMGKNGDLQILQEKANLKTQAKAKQDLGFQMLNDQAAQPEIMLPGEKKLVKMS